MKQLAFLKKEPSAYGGDLLKTRKGRSRSRPLATNHTMHLVLRSSRAKGDLSFRRPKHAKRIQELVDKHSRRYGVRVISLANVGNHLHFQIKLSHRRLYAPFIRALTGSVAMAVTGKSRWSPREPFAAEKSGPSLRSSGATKERPPRRFWDYRPFTRIVQSLRALLNLRDYIRINQLEGAGYPRTEARWLVTRGWRGT